MKSLNRAAVVQKTHCKMIIVPLLLLVVNVAAHTEEYEDVTGSQWKSFSHIKEGYTTKDGQEIDPTRPEIGLSRWEAHSGSDDHHSTEAITPGTKLSSVHGWTFTSLDDNSLLTPHPTNMADRSHTSLYTLVNLTTFSGPLKIVAHSRGVVLNLFAMDPTIITTPEFVHIFGGNGLIEDSLPLAQRYGGIHYGVWQEEMGDGRVITLGETTDVFDRKWEVQLKGIGPTPYSRGDGRLSLKEAIRELLGSESIHFLGGPSIRTASLSISPDRVKRLVNNQVRDQPASVIARTSRSWVRFGTLELLSKSGQHDELKEVLDKLIKRLHPDLNTRHPDRYIHFFKKVLQSTAQMVAKWMAVGFTHGAMHTDNFNVAGLTMDYNHFRYQETFLQDFVANPKDVNGEHSFMKQPKAAYQNLGYLHVALKPILNTNQQEKIQAELQKFEGVYLDHLYHEMNHKLGIHDVPRRDKQDFMVRLIFIGMEETKCDFTKLFRELGEWDVEEMRKMYIPEHLTEIHKLSKYKFFEELIDVYVASIYDHYRPAGSYDEKRFKDFQRIHPNWNDKIRRDHMANTNPRYVLREWMIENVIEAAEQGDFHPLQELLHIIQSPFRLHKEAEAKGYGGLRPLDKIKI